jgi:hypothetical protein
VVTVVNMVVVVVVAIMEEVEQLTIIGLVVVEVILFDNDRFPVLYDETINICMHAIGGSSYIGGCYPANLITYLPGVTGNTNTETMPGGSTRSDYIPGVGVGKVGVYATPLQSPGGNGAIVLTFIPRTAPPSTFPTSAPSYTPTTALPTYAPSTIPTTARPTTAPSSTPSTALPTYAPSVVPTYQLPICPVGWTLNFRYSCNFKEEHVFLEDSPVSNDVYQPVSFDTVLPSLSSEIKYAVGGFVAGITLMLVLYFCTRASKEKYVYPNRTEYTPIMEHE